MEEIGADSRHQPAIQIEGRHSSLFDDMNDTHDNGCLARPYMISASGKDRPSITGNPEQTRFSSIALCDRLCGNQSTTAVPPSKCECTSKEVGHIVCISACLLIVSD